MKNELQCALITKVCFQNDWLCWFCRNMPCERQYCPRQKMELMSTTFRVTGFAFQSTNYTGKCVHRWTVRCIANKSVKRPWVHYGRTIKRTKKNNSELKLQCGMCLNKLLVLSFKSVKLTLSSYDVTNHRVFLYTFKNIALLITL